jgi:hypothetical protein
MYRPGHASSSTISAIPMGSADSCEVTLGRLLFRRTGRPRRPGVVYVAGMPGLSLVAQAQAAREVEKQIAANGTIDDAAVAAFVDDLEHEAAIAAGHYTREALDAYRRLPRLPRLPQPSMPALTRTVMTVRAPRRASTRQPNHAFRRSTRGSSRGSPDDGDSSDSEPVVQLEPGRTAAAAVRMAAHISRRQRHRFLHHREAVAA